VALREERGGPAPRRRSHPVTRLVLHAAYPEIRGPSRYPDIDRSTDGVRDALGRARYSNETRPSTDSIQKAPRRSRYGGRDSTDTTQKAPGRSMRRDLLCSSVGRYAPSLRCLLRPGAVERPAPFGPTRICGATVVGGGPAGSAATYLTPSARHLGLPASGRASPVGRSTSVVLRWRARRFAREGAARSRARREPGEGRGGCRAVRGGAVQSRYGSHVACSHPTVIRGGSITLRYLSRRPQ
jgi:hypothetical protein